jgi:glycosyltransferase involved in cell wall biosynthesis
VTAAAGSKGGRRVIWLLQDGEPLPLDDSPRLMRTGDQAHFLARAGWDVVWWASRFNHPLKQRRDHSSGPHRINDGLTIWLLDGPSYSRNFSLSRIRHYRALAREFTRQAASLPRPDLILGSYPSPELCEAGARHARSRGIPFVVDVRDPWPDIFEDYFPQALSWMIRPVVSHYQRIFRTIARSAQSVVAVSEAMRGWALRYAGRAPSCLDVVIPIGYRADAVGRVIEVPPVFSQNDPLICLFATTCGRSYDGESLIDAARILESGGEDRFKVVVTGAGEMFGAWRARAEGLRSVHFTGWVTGEEWQTLFRTAHLGMVLLKPRGIARFWMGNKFFEYLASYLGLVNSVSGEAAGLVMKTGVGVNVTAGDPVALGNALRGLLNSPQDVRNYMEAARSVFHQQFDRESIQQRYSDHLNAVLASYQPCG